MGVGTGIFLSTLLILLALGFSAPNGRRILKGVALVLAVSCGLAVAIAMVAWLADYWTSLPRPAHTMCGISLGSDEADALISKGEPSTTLTVSGEKIYKYKKEYTDFQFEFRSKDGAITAIAAYRDGYCTNETGSYVGMSEEGLLSKLGKATGEKKYPSEYAKLIYFNELNIAAIIEKGKVVTLIAAAQPSRLVLNSSNKEDRLK